MPAGAPECIVIHALRQPTAHRADRARSSLTAFETLYLCAEPFLPYLYQDVRRRLRETVDQLDSASPEILDVGGRKSHYTIGLPGKVTVSDLPRLTELQHNLNLGVTEEISARVRRRRSNVHEVLIDDMTRSTLPDECFHCVVAVEVLEHVAEDAAFVRHVHRVLKRGGAFLMTTPNGDHLGPPTNPDHKRHYTRRQLHNVLQPWFAPLAVEYAVRGSRSYERGLESWSARHPMRTIIGMMSNVLNAQQSSRSAVKDDAMGTQHLVAIGWKA